MAIDSSNLKNAIQSASLAILTVSAELNAFDGRLGDGDLGASSASLAVSYGTNGWGGSASASKASGNSDNPSVTQNNTHIAATDTASIISQGDTNLTGATVTGNTVTANVGGNLNLQSLQDTAQSSAHQQSAGGSVSYSQYGGGSGSFSA
jgi:filamentous hemagglutinin